MIFDPRLKLYLLLLGNLLLFFHVSLRCEIILMLFFLLPFFFTNKRKLGLRLSITYFILVLLDIYLVPITHGIVLNWIGLLASGIRMMYPCIVTGSYAFSTTSVSEFVCALRKMKVPETIVIPCMVVIRFFPTIKEDFQQIKNAMAIRGIQTDILHPFQTLEYLLMPLLMNSNTVSQDLTIAALTKGISIQEEHTSLVSIHFSLKDGFYMILCTILFILFK